MAHAYHFTHEMERMAAERAQERVAMQQQQGRAVSRLLVTSEDKAMFIPELVDLYTALDRIVAAC